MLTVVPRVFLATRGLAQPAVAQKQGEPLSVGLFNDIRENLQGSGRSVDKILVKTGRAGQFVVNRHISTPLTCAKHVSRHVVNSCALARALYESGGTEILSPQARLTQPCTLEFLDFAPAKEEDAVAVNQAFWRSASVLTAAVASRALSSQAVLPSLGKFSDAFFSSTLPESLSVDDVKQLDKLSHEVIASDTVFDHLLVPESVAQQYGFDSSVNLCRLDDYVCLVDGPTIASPRQITQFKLLTALFREGTTHLVGTALPLGQKTSSFNWDLICQNAIKKFNAIAK